MHFLIKTGLIFSLFSVSVQVNAYNPPIKEVNRDSSVRTGPQIVEALRKECEDQVDTLNQLHQNNYTQTLKHADLQCKISLLEKDLDYANISCAQATHNGTIALLNSQCDLRVQTEQHKGESEAKDLKHDIFMCQYKLNQTLEQLQQTLKAKELPSSSETLNTATSTSDTSSYFTLTNLAYVGIPTVTAIALYCFHKWALQLQQPGAINLAGAGALGNGFQKLFVTPDNGLGNNVQQGFQPHPHLQGYNTPPGNPYQGSMGESVIAPHLQKSTQSRPLRLELTPTHHSSLSIQDEEDADGKEEEDNEAEYNRRALALERERLEQAERLENARIAENQRQFTINQAHKQEKLRQQAEIAAKQQEQEQQKLQQNAEALRLKEEKLAQKERFKRAQLAQDADIAAQQAEQKRQRLQQQDEALAIEKQRLAQQAAIAAQQAAIAAQQAAIAAQQAAIAAQQAAPAVQQSSSSSSSLCIVDGIKKAEQADFKKNDEAPEDDLEIDPETQETQISNIIVRANPTAPAPMAIILHRPIVHNPVQFHPFLHPLTQLRALLNFNQPPAPQQPLPTQTSPFPTNFYTHILGRLMNGQNALTPFFPQMNQGFVLNNQALIPINAIVPFQAPRQPSLIDTLIGNWPRLAVMQNGRLFLGRSLFLAAIPVVAQLQNPLTQFLNKYRQADSKKPAQSE